MKLQYEMMNEIFEVNIFPGDITKLLQLKLKESDLHPMARIEQFLLIYSQESGIDHSK